MDDHCNNVVFLTEENKKLGSQIKILKSVERQLTGKIDRAVSELALSKEKNEQLENQLHVLEGIVQQLKEQHQNADSDLFTLEKNKGNVYTQTKSFKTLQKISNDKSAKAERDVNFQTQNKQLYAKIRNQKAIVTNYKENREDISILQEENNRLKEQIKYTSYNLTGV